MATHPRLLGIGLRAPWKTLRRIPVPIPATADAEKQSNRTKKDLDLRAASNEPHKTSDTPDTQEARPLNKDSRPIPAGIPLSLDPLISDTSRRVRLEKRTRLPSTSSSPDAQQFCLMRSNRDILL